MSTRQARTAVWINRIGFLYALLVAGVLLIWKPNWTGPVETARMIDALGTGVCLLLAVHLFRGLSALPVLFGRPGTPWCRAWAAVWCATGLLALVSAIPQVSRFTLPLLFAVHAAMFLRTRFYSIENLLFQNALFHLAAARMAGWLAWMGMPMHEPLVQRLEATALNAFFVSLGLLMHSAGLEKLKSPVWRRGEGTLQFFRQRHLIRPVFARLTNGMPAGLFVVLGYGVLVAELALLPTLFWRPSLVPTALVLAGFSCSLFIVTDISFIGQVLAVELAVLLWAAFGWSGDFAGGIAALHGEDFLFLVSVSLTCVAVHFPALSGRLQVKWLQHLGNGINNPVGVFTEAHLDGVMIYQFRASEGDHELPQVFEKNGTAGCLQHLRPRYLQSAMYLVGRVVRKAGGRDELSPKDRDFLLDLMACALQSCHTHTGGIQLLVADACQNADEVPVWKLFATGRFDATKPAQLTIHSDA